MGALDGLRVVEIAGLGPTPFAAMWLADHGAEVIRLTRPGTVHVLGMQRDLLDRGRDWVEVDLKTQTGRETARSLIGAADAVIEGMRPGTMERLGLGPHDFPDHPALVYGRMTGWGQTGPLAHSAGHDITYLAATGVLSSLGPVGRPLPPMNLLGDFGGGAMYLVAGMLAALLSARVTGRGQVVDAAITDGTAHMATMIWGMRAEGHWADMREANLLDGAAPFYTTYRCRDGGWIAVGAIEPQFWAQLCAALGLDPAALPDRMDRSNWQALRATLAQVFVTRDRDDWAAQLEGTDACAGAVLSMAEAAAHPHNIARGVHGPDGPAPAPRLTGTPGVVRAGGRLTAEAAVARWAASRR